MTGTEMEPGTETGGGTMAHLAKLFDMARDRSPAGRRALADRVGDFYFAGHNLSKRERDLVVDILRQVIRDAEMDVRLGLAERLAVHEQAPHDLIVTLANDRIEIAEFEFVFRPVGKRQPGPFGARRDRLFEPALAVGFAFRLFTVDVDRVFHVRDRRLEI